jgi:hypothetical protein
VITGTESVTPSSRLSPVFVELRPVLVQAPVARQLGLQDHQVVQAVVEMRDGQLKLTLNGQALNAPLAGFMKEGDKLAMKTQVGVNGQVSLSFMSVIPPAQPMLQERMQLPTMVTTLLHQPAMFNNWIRLMTPAMLQSLLPTMSAALYSAMLGGQLSMANLKPATLREWMLKGTRSSEAALLKDEPVDGDLKVILRSLIGSDQDGADDDRGEAQDSNNSHDILRQAVTEIEATQVRSVQDLQQGDLSLTLIIPFVDAHPVKLHIEKRRQKPGQPAQPLVINMHTDNPDLGELWLKSSLSGPQQQVDLTMWALRSDTAQKAMQSASELTYELESSGLRMGSFQVFNAPRPTVVVGSDAPVHGSVIDTKV